MHVLLEVMNYRYTCYLKLGNTCTHVNNEIRISTLVLNMNTTNRLENVSFINNEEIVVSEGRY